MLRNARPSLTAVTRRIPKSPVIRARPESTTTTPSKRASPPVFEIFKPTRAPVRKVSPDEKDASPSQKRFLKPYELSERLTKLCDEGKLDEAVDTLKNMPLDAQNTIVWSNIIRHAGRANRYQLAYTLYIEMKRRGFKANSRTYGTLMGVFNRITSWTERTKLLQNVHKTYESYVEYLELVRRHNPVSPELNLYPINTYLSVLSKAQEWQRMFDVYNSLDSLNLPPDKFTFTVMLYSLGIRSTDAMGDDPQAQAVRERAASDARLIWRQLMKRIENGASIDIDAQLVDAIIQPLALGRPADQIAAFDILRDYAGLAKPGETAPPPSVELTPILLSDVLWLCNTSKKYRLTVHFVQQLMKTNPDMLDRGHMDHALAAYGALSALGSSTESAHALQTLEWMLDQELTRTPEDAAKLRPGRASYTLALVPCWRGKDWDSALRTFELMTGFRGTDFADGTTVPVPTPSPRGPGWNITPDAAAISCLVRAAHASGDPAAMRQCARIVRRIGLGHPLAAADAAHKEGKRAAPRFQKDATFYAHKTASALVELVDVLVPKKTEESTPLTDEEREWVKLRSEARTYLVYQQRPQTTPLLEEQLLGSEEGLKAMDSAVVWDRISREQKK